MKYFLSIFLCMFTLVSLAETFEQRLQAVLDKYEFSSLQTRSSVNESTILHEATEAGDIEAVKLLLDAGMRVDVVNRSHNTALHRASYEGYLDIVKLLVSRGANVNALSRFNTTALDYALKFFDEDEVIEYLLSVGGKKGEDLWKEDTESEFTKVLQ